VQSSCSRRSDCVLHFARQAARSLARVLRSGKECALSE
jgi:hypothetical protein